MSIVRNERDEFWTLADNSLECFFCGDEIGFPFLFWAGQTGSIALHKKCFIDLAARLFRDWHELEKETRP